MDDVPRISYGCDVGLDNRQAIDQMHHLFDYGITGTGIAGTLGHSERSICGHVLSHENHIYMPALSINMMKELFESIMKKESKLNFCPVCVEIFHAITKGLYNLKGFKCGSEEPKQ